MKFSMLASVSAFAILCATPSFAANQTCYDLALFGLYCPVDSTGDHDHGTPGLDNSDVPARPEPPPHECPPHDPKGNKPY